LQNSMVMTWSMLFSNNLEHVSMFGPKNAGLFTWTGIGLCVVGLCVVVGTVLGNCYPPGKRIPHKVVGKREGRGQTFISAINDAGVTVGY